MTKTLGPYRTPVKMSPQPKICGLSIYLSFCTSEVYPGHEYCCFCEHELYGINEPWQGCGNPGCECWP